MKDEAFPRRLQYRNSIYISHMFSSDFFPFSQTELCYWTFVGAASFPRLNGGISRVCQAALVCGGFNN
jgi:hypothetical protein